MRLDSTASRVRASAAYVSTRSSKVRFASSIIAHSSPSPSTPRTFRDVARVGPISRQAGRIDTFLADSKLTGVVAVAAPEEMPVNETIDFLTALEDEMAMKPDAVVVNGVYPERFRDAEMAAIDAAGLDSPELRAAVASYRRARHHRNQVRRLRRRAAAVTLPFLFEPELGDEALEALTNVLERRLR